MLAPALTILLSSFLLFLVQPILAKQILPWFGGSAGVWTVCLVFFQLVLLLGYTYAHWLRRVGSRQFALHMTLLLISCMTLPIIPSSYWKQAHASGPALQILGLLCLTVGLPYFLLASTAPLLQRWLGTATDSLGVRRSIYRLFALSNLGSLFGLLSYPFAIEPFATLRTQAWVWSCAYLLFVASSVSYAWYRRRRPDLPQPVGAAGATAPEVPPSLASYAYWIGCATLGSTLLLAGTNQITQNVAAIPLLWIVPLSMYLVSFVICFEGRSGRGWYERRFWITPAMLAAGAMAWALFADRGNLSLYSALPVFTVGVLLGCVVCHGELARSKPSPNYLTHFYLSLATGGALGGMLVALVAPQVFDGYWEMPLALICLEGLALYCCCEELRRTARTSWAANLLSAAAATALILLLLGGLPSAWDRYALPWAKIVQGEARWGCAALLLVSVVLLQRYRLWRAVALTALLCTVSFDWSYYRSLSTGTEFAARNFYGTLRVTESPYSTWRIRELKHGVILHGSQVMAPAQRDVPTAYFGTSSGIGRTLLAKHRAMGTLRIGSVGLGAGTLAAYGQPGDLFRVYELNPAVLDIAENQFTYLKDSKAEVEPVLGDARLSLEREIAQGAFDRPEQRFDVLSLDAFSGDAIPVHLLTSEAFVTYVRAIKPDGVIAFHLSNIYLNLPPVVDQIARAAGFASVLVTDRPSMNDVTADSDWVLVTRDTSLFREPELGTYVTPITPRTLPRWTDQFSNLLQILK